MAERTTVARPYANAAFQIAREQNALPRWSEMVKLAEAIGADAQMADALANPKLDAGDKASLFLSIAGDRFTEDMRSFVRVLIEADRIELLPEIRDAVRGVAQRRGRRGEGDDRDCVAALRRAARANHRGVVEALRQAHRGDRRRSIRR